MRPRNVFSKSPVANISKKIFKIKKSGNNFNIFFYQSTEQPKSKEIQTI